LAEQNFNFTEWIALLLICSRFDDFPQTFIHDIHFVGFDLKDKVIVDVGAFVGDTALYYANFGAIVYAYEPHPVNFYWLKKNIELNPQLKDRIKIFNEG